MQKSLFIIFCVSIFILSGLDAYPQYYLAYDYVIELGINALEHQDYDEAIRYFTIAQLLKPYSKEPLFYINLAKRLKEGLVEEILPWEHYLKEKKREIPRYYVEEKELKEDRERKIKGALESLEEEIKKTPEEIKEEIKPKKIYKELEELKEEKTRKIFEQKECLRREKREKVIGDSLSLWNKIMEEKAAEELREAEAVRKQKEANELKEAEAERKRKAAEEFKRAEAERKKKAAAELKKAEAVREEKETVKIPKPIRKPQVLVRKSSIEVLPKEGEVRTLYLTDELFATQPKTVIELSLGSELIIESEESIKRYFIINPRPIEVERIDDRRIKIIAKNIGTTFLHLWEPERRWTFNVEVVPRVTAPKKKKLAVHKAQPFKIFHNIDWSSYHSGSRLRNLERESLSFKESLGIYGDTPYGNMNGSLRLAKYADEMKVTNYTLGLSEGKFLNLDNFRIQGFDIYKSFSELSYPGELLKGILWEDDIFNKKVNYSVVWGKEREGLYGYVSPGVLQKRDTYIEGLRVTFSPASSTRHSINFARGHGTGRADYLNDRVYSLQSRYRKDSLSILSEAACDEDSFAGFFNSQFSLDRNRFTLNLRNIEKDFTTITGRVANQGEIGALLGADLKLSEEASFSSKLDIYRNRYIATGASVKTRPNFDSSSRLNLRLDPTSSLSSNLYYINASGLSFPRQYFNLRTTYSKRYKLFNEIGLSTFLGTGYQRSRNPLSRSSDYSLNTLFAGSRLRLTKSLSCYLNYNYSWVRETLSDELSRPAVLQTGLNYRKKIAPNLSGDVSFYYRDEENATGSHSFLAGEDSIEGTLHLGYTPHEGTEIFLDGRIRNVWAENPDTNKLMESEIRLGFRGSWETPLRWDPRGEVCGFVFQDLNADGEKDEDEPALGGIKIVVGTKEVITDEQGYFSTPVRAKKVVVMLKVDSLPQGYILTVPYLHEVDIGQGKKSRIYFGTSTSTSISGLAFCDLNSNGKYDLDEELLGGVRLIMGERKAVTNSGGRYFIRGLDEGEYTVVLDLNSVPMEYIPSVSIKKRIELFEGVDYIYNIPFKKSRK